MTDVVNNVKHCNFHYIFKKKHYQLMHASNWKNIEHNRFNKLQFLFHYIHVQGTKIHVNEVGLSLMKIDVIYNQKNNCTLI